jgi:hypothetical protein
MNDAPKKRLPIRWLSLAEIVGVAALAIAALGWWDNHRERIQQDRERARSEREHAQTEAENAKEKQQQAQQDALRHALLITGTPEGDGARLKLQATRGEQVIKTQTLAFPTEIKPDSVSTTGNPRIEARWIEDSLRKVAKTGGRLPVAVETTFIEDGETRTDRAVYRVGYSFSGRLLGGPQLHLEGLSLARRGVTGDLQTAANSYWLGSR